MLVNYHTAVPTPELLFEDQKLFRVGEAHYLGLPVTELPPAAGLETPAPSLITIVHWPLTKDQGTESDWLAQQIRTWLDTDDVFRPEFLRDVLVVVHDSSDHQRAAVSSSIARLPGGWQPTRWSLVSNANINSKLYSGAHIISGKKIYRVLRLYDDVNGAFMVATNPLNSPSERFSNLRISGNYPSTLGVAVPSRIRNPKRSKPLSGLRFAVKDCFNIRGLRVSAGDRAYYDVTEPSTATSESIQRLIDAGAELLGTLKLGSLIAREEPTESVDFQAPFNPRADGYQSAWSSSGGSGAAIASYDWLDFTIGTDTTGSSRRPAMANGVFQIRLTYNAIPLDDAVPSFPRFDAVAIFTRSIVSMEKWVQPWLGQNQAIFDDLPLNIVYPTDFLPIDNSDQMALIDNFLSDLEATLNAKVQKVSIADTWAAGHPTGVENVSIQDYLKDVGVNTFVYGVYDKMEGFRKKYRTQYAREPYVNPVTRYRWDLAKDIPREAHEEDMKRLDVYKDWVLENIMREKTHNSLVVLPITSQAVDYREDPPEPPSPPNAFDGIWLAPVTGGPEISVPIGELKYHSRISGRDEFLPVVVSILGKPGYDLGLIRLMKDVLQRSGRPTQVNTGRRMFHD
ncbi:amidase signature domain-containing protein [Nemania sp. FL0031]|nr:amidase signature domain-containing protein [Nemania sp. FL0031]